MATLSSVRSLTLDLPPSCIAFCPTQPHLFVVGTYFLQGKEQQNSSPSREDNEDIRDGTIAEKRTGSLILYTLHQEEITCISTTPTDFAILDIQWTRHPENLGNLLAVATSTGLLAFYLLQPPTEPAAQPRLILSSVKKITESSILVLSLTWHPIHPHILGVTLSNGSVQLCESSTEPEPWNTNAVVSTHDIQQHSLEAWTLAFSPHGGEEILSGGDDSILQCSRIGQEGEEPIQLWQDRKLHQAGVTAILPLSDILVITGSYDDHIRLVHIPKLGRKTCLADLHLGGGVWRLKILSSSQEENHSALQDMQEQSFFLLASCMHAGTRIVRLTRVEKEDEAEWEFHVLGKFEEHQSMNYGSDVQPTQGAGGADRQTIVSTSFYDKLMCLWHFDVT